MKLAILLSLVSWMIGTQSRCSMDKTTSLFLTGICGIIEDGRQLLEWNFNPLRARATIEDFGTVVMAGGKIAVGPGSKSKVLLQVRAEISTKGELFILWPCSTRATSSGLGIEVGLRINKTAMTRGVWRPGR